MTAGFTRRGFLKLGGLAVAGLGLRPRRSAYPATVFPEHERLGRVTGGRVDLNVRPDFNSPSVGVLYEDAVVPWLAERVGPHPNRVNQRWVETPEGYVHAPLLQPVRNSPNAPVSRLAETSLGAGMWAEVTVPYVDVLLENPPARSPWLQNALAPRLYYSQIVWIDRVVLDDAGKATYRVNERYGFGDLLWAAAEAFRPIKPEEVDPIGPSVEEKRVVVNVSDQTLACYEGSTEVYHCRVSTGAKFNASGEAVDAWATPLGRHPIWRKAISIHMVGGTTGGGWDLPGIGWTTLFVGNGVAIHSTFWHNDFGVPRSRGCVNARPRDAKWVFRWVAPVVPYDPGDVTVSMPGGTRVEVFEA